ncbi:hypothetical protein [Aeromonas caviae]|uniref:hypothetical protein n=1 Tax=Aeromonas caviae TaxID=648 RepID=UPI0029D9160E|nr:hypothetical protein [Aeromonas caviae]MDX7711783.1 hypothetical protein [Aeromonas caviae]
MQVAERTKTGRKVKAVQESRKASAFYYDRPTMDARLRRTKREGKLVPQELNSSNDILEWLLAQ